MNTSTPFYNLSDISRGNDTSTTIGKNTVSEDKVNIQGTPETVSQSTEAVTTTPDLLIANGEYFMMIFGSLLAVIIVTVVCSMLWRRHKKKRQRQRENSIELEEDNVNHSEQQFTDPAAAGECTQTAGITVDERLHIDTCVASSSQRISEVPDTPDFEYISAPLTRPRVIKTSQSTMASESSLQHDMKIDDPVSYENLQRVSSSRSESDGSLEMRPESAIYSEVKSKSERAQDDTAKNDNKLTISPVIDGDLEGVDNDSEVGVNRDDVDAYIFEDNMEQILDAEIIVVSASDSYCMSSANTNTDNTSANELETRADNHTSAAVNTGIYVHDAQLADEVIIPTPTPADERVGVYVDGAREVSESTNHNADTHESLSEGDNCYLNTIENENPSDNHRDSYSYCDVQSKDHLSKSLNAINPGLYVQDPKLVDDNRIYDSNVTNNDLFSTLPPKYSQHPAGTVATDQTYSYASHTLPNTVHKLSHRYISRGVYVHNPQLVDEAAGANHQQDKIEKTNTSAASHPCGVYVHNPKTVYPVTAEEKSASHKGLFLHSPDISKYLTDTRIPLPVRTQDRRLLALVDTTRGQEPTYDYCDGQVGIDDWLQTPVLPSKYVTQARLVNTSDHHHNTLSHNCGDSPTREAKHMTRAKTVDHKKQVYFKGH